MVGEGLAPFPTSSDACRFLLSHDRLDWRFLDHFSMIRIFLFFFAFFVSSLSIAGTCTWSYTHEYYTMQYPNAGYTFSGSDCVTRMAGLLPGLHTCEPSISAVPNGNTGVSGTIIYRSTFSGTDYTHYGNFSATCTAPDEPLTDYNGCVELPAGSSPSNICLNGKSHTVIGAAPTGTSNDGSTDRYCGSWANTGNSCTGSDAGGSETTPDDPDYVPVPPGDNLDPVPSPIAPPTPPTDPTAPPTTGDNFDIKKGIYDLTERITTYFDSIKDTLDSMGSWMDTFGQKVDTFMTDVENFMTGMNSQYAQDGAAALSAPEANPLKNPQTIDMSNILDTTVNGSGACPPPATADVMGQTLTFDYSSLCDWADTAGKLIMMIAGLISIRMLLGSA